MSKSLLYWIAQFLGWFLYIAVAIIVYKINGEPLEKKHLTDLSTVYVLGIIGSHIYRTTMIKLGWLDLAILKLIPRIIFGSILFSGIIELLFNFVLYIVDTSEFEFDFTKIVTQTISWSVLLFIWSSFYYSYHFFYSFRQEEIKNLKWEANRSEMELSLLKSQLNPHFIFNSMNTIRALVDEEPQKAKDNITKLAIILRSTLVAGKKKEVSLKDELKLIKDFLSLEQSRFEERLHTEFNISPETMEMHVPPMMLQTLIENCVKHGISKLAAGGIIIFNTSKQNNNLAIEIINSGKYAPSATKSNNSTKIGINGTVKRLHLLYGEKATFEIFNKDNFVITKLIIPQNLSHE